MSVYKRPGAATYSYDFRLQNRRFSGDTGKAQKREAEAVERLKRDEARAEVAEGRSLEAPDTWELAASRYWLEVGQHHVNRETTLKSLDWLTRHLGRQTRLADIDDNRVAGLVALRRADRRQVGRSDARDRQRPVSAATVNRTMTEPLRKVLLRARGVWKVKIGEVSWRKHLLKEPRERVREASLGEEAAIGGALERGYDEAVAFGFRDGCRRMEICGLVWSRVDFFGRRYTVIGKGGKARTIPMSQATFDQLFRLRGQHPEFVFTFVAQKTRKELGQVRGQRYPIQLGTLSKLIRRAAARTGVQDFHLHDTRHTAATRVLRKSNLRVVQQLLGHEDIATTTKYAHALADDIRAALDATSPTKSPTSASTDATNPLRDLGKAG